MHAYLRAPLRSRHNLHCTATPFDTSDDRFADAQTIRGNRSDVKAFAVVTYEHFDHVITRFAIHGNRFSAVGHGVDERLLRGVEQRVGLCVSSTCAAISFNPALTERSDVVRS